MLRSTLAIGAVAGALAQGGARPHPLSNIPPAHPDVETSSMILGHDASALPVREPLKVVASIINNGDSPLNISGIIGSLNNPLDFAQFMHNFTGRGIGDVVIPGEEITVEYQFMVPEMPEYPMNLQMALTVFYEDDSAAGGYYANTFYNETVTFVPTTVRPKVENYLNTILGGASVLLFLALAVAATPYLNERKYGKLELLSGGSTVLGGVEEKDDFDEAQLNIKAGRSKKD